jgi:hypothetical protein
MFFLVLPFSYSFSIRFFFSSIYTSQQYISASSFAFSFHIVILLLFITPPLLAPHSNLTIFTSPLLQTILSANHTASDPVLTKVCFPEEKT